MDGFLGQDALGGLSFAEKMSLPHGARAVVLGATSVVGMPLLASLASAGIEVLAVSRNAPQAVSPGVTWCCPAALTDECFQHIVQRFDACPWICLAPLWVLGDYLAAPLLLRPSKVVALSSTSRFSKETSAVPAERVLAQWLANAEDQLMAWAKARGLPWLILRPTMIHGYGRDQNVAAIARFICRYGFFPLLGQGSGLRRPIHASEVAEACIQAILHDHVANLALTISGAETLSYAEMVVRVFATLGRKPRLVRIPRWMLSLVLASLHFCGLARAWSIGMADRMDQDLAYSSEDACALLNLHFNAFRPDTLAQGLN